MCRANAYSTDSLALSTARLYTLISLATRCGVSASQILSTTPVLNPPVDADKTNGKLCGGSISFGGGVVFYRNKPRIGGLGVRSDTACADYEIAKRIRHLANLDPERGAYADGITIALSTARR